MCSLAGDTVVDPFAGSGTTAEAAYEADRNSISMDVEAGYVAIMEQGLLERGVSPSQLQVSRSCAKASERENGVSLSQYRRLSLQRSVDQ
jgi:DNA modification methylase